MHACMHGKVIKVYLTLTTSQAKLWLHRLMDAWGRGLWDGKGDGIKSITLYKLASIDHVYMQCKSLHVIYALR